MQGQTVVKDILPHLRETVRDHDGRNRPAFGECASFQACEARRKCEHPLKAAVVKGVFTDFRDGIGHCHLCQGLDVVKGIGRDPVCPAKFIVTARTGRSRRLDRCVFEHFRTHAGDRTRHDDLFQAGAAAKYSVTQRREFCRKSDRFERRSVPEDFFLDSCDSIAIQFFGHHDLPGIIHPFGNGESFL